MTSVPRDENSIPVWYGISCTDGVSLIPIAIEPTLGGLKVDISTTISFTPGPLQALLRDDNQVPVRHGISTSDDHVILPLYVNPANGALLMQN